MAPCRRTKGRLRVGALAGALAFACGRGPAAPSSTSLSVSHWTGTTAQSTSIAFTVSPDETLTTIAVGYRFNGCSGNQTFSDLRVPTVPNVTCIPGPCSGALSTYRAFAHSSPSIGAGPVTTVGGFFVASGRAEGQASFATTLAADLLLRSNGRQQSADRALVATGHVDRAASVAHNRFNELERPIPRARASDGLTALAAPLFDKLAWLASAATCMVTDGAVIPPLARYRRPSDLGSLPSGRLVGPRRRWERLSFERP